MIIRCPKCSKSYGQQLFNHGVDFYCSCGEKLNFKPKQVFAQLEQICKDHELKIKEENIIKIRKSADRIVSLIFNNDSSKIEIDIEKNKFKQLIKQISPEKADLYELIYEPRFDRLWNQFRESSDKQD